MKASTEYEIIRYRIKSVMIGLDGAKHLDSWIAEFESEAEARAWIDRYADPAKFPNVLQCDRI